jgi:hypothetical protein
MKTLICSTLLIGSLISAHAQQASIPWFKIAGGGSTSTGAQFSVSGTIGQHDAGGPLSGGNFTLLGGFWVLPTVIQTPGAPLLSIEQTPAGVRVFWQLPATGFVLDESTALASSQPATVWSQVPVATYETNATQISVTVTPVGSRFYRLRKL